MANIVIGVASSHTPQLSSGVDMWLDHAERDRRNPMLLGKDARYHSYDELLARADPAIEQELAPAVWDGKYQRCQQAIEALTARLDKAHPDIAVVIGDDQREMFKDDGIPAFACFTGTELVDLPPSGEALERMPKGIRAASWAAHGDRPAVFDVDLEPARRDADAAVRAVGDARRHAVADRGRWARCDANASVTSVTQRFPRAGVTSRIHSTGNRDPSEGPHAGNRKWGGGGGGSSPPPSSVVSFLCACLSAGNALL